MSVDELEVIVGVVVGHANFAHCHHARLDRRRVVGERRLNALLDVFGYSLPVIVLDDQPLDVRALIPPRKTVQFLYCIDAQIERSNRFDDWFLSLHDPFDCLPYLFNNRRRGPVCFANTAFGQQPVGPPAAGYNPPLRGLTV